MRAVERGTPTCGSSGGAFRLLGEELLNVLDHRANRLDGRLQLLGRALELLGPVADLVVLMDVHACGVGGAALGLVVRHDALQRMSSFPGRTCKAGAERATPDPARRRPGPHRLT